MIENLNMAFHLSKINKSQTLYKVSKSKKLEKTVSIHLLKKYQD